LRTNRLLKNLFSPQAANLGRTAPTSRANPRLQSSTDTLCGNSPCIFYLLLDFGQGNAPVIVGQKHKKIVVSAGGVAPFAKRPAQSYQGQAEF